MNTFHLNNSELKMKAIQSSHHASYYLDNMTTGGMLGNFRRKSVWLPPSGLFIYYIFISNNTYLPVVPHKAVAEVSKIGNL